MKPDSWQPLFFDMLLAERGASRNTLLAYQRDIGDFAARLVRQHLDFATATRETITDWLAACDAAGLSPATRARRLSAVRQLYRFATAEGWITSDPACRLSGPRKARRLPGTLSEAQINTLLQAAQEFGNAQAKRLRNTCLLELLYATGMRVSELVTLPAASLRGDPAMLLLRGKGGRERMVPLSAPAKQAARAWLRLRDADDAARVATGSKASPYLFPAAGKHGHLARERCFAILKDLAVHAGISPALVSPHVLRHAFASHLLGHGADLRVIQTLLGHADLATTEIYTHVIDDKLRELVLTRHPLAET
jgi:integrase/recombinase XerD